MALIGVISAYPDEDWHAQRIFAAAAAVADAEELSPLDFSADVRVDDVALLVRGLPHQRFDVLLTPRALGDEGEHELQLELYRALAADGALMINEVGALTTAIDKFRTSWLLARAGLPTPRVLVTQKMPDALAALTRLGGRAVAKPLYGSLGIGVSMVSTEDEVAHCLQRWGAVYLQEFVDGGGHDVRAFVIGERVAAAIRRSAGPEDFRTNVHLGGKAEPVDLDERSARLAVRAAQLLGLDYAGVDLLHTVDGPTVLEVNGTPLFRGIFEATGRDMAPLIVGHAMARLFAGGRRAEDARAPAGGLARGARGVAMAASSPRWDAGKEDGKAPH